VFFTFPTIFHYISWACFFNPQRGIECFPSLNTLYSGNPRYVVDCRGNPLRKTRQHFSDFLQVLWFPLGTRYLTVSCKLRASRFSSSVECVILLPRWVAENTTALHGLVHSTRIICVIVLKNKYYLIWC
jgi:hypothetical protein